VTDSYDVLGYLEGSVESFFIFVPLCRQRLCDGSIPVREIHQCLYRWFHNAEKRDAIDRISLQCHMGRNWAFGFVFVLAPSPLRFTTREIFPTEPLQSYFLCNILSDERMCLPLMNMLGLLSSVLITHIACYWKFFFCTIYKSSLSPCFAKQIMPILLILCYNGSLVTWRVVSLTSAKFKLLIFS
jgi:hypothetical protein